jgi:hypothetical protein
MIVDWMMYGNEEDCDINEGLMVGYSDAATAIQNNTKHQAPGSSPGPSGKQLHKRKEVKSRNAEARTPKTMRSLTAA